MIEFEVRDKDLLARIGRFRTKSGTVETPIFLPVINPAREVVKPRELWDLFGCNALITNAYIVKKYFGEKAKERGIHGILDFPGVVMTDSGAYQILAYGSVEVTNEEIIRYQEEIDTDIATILDVPTGWGVSSDHAKYTVDETLRRAKELENLRRRMDIAWVGPIQGGCFLNLVASSAREIGNLPFHIHALGSPTPVMEQYLFTVLVDMVLTAKMNAPINRPFHLFGAGHPLIFPLIVALGCDIFDSAAYSLFARENRYLTDYGTMHLKDLEYLPCSCPVCVKYEPRDLMEMPKDEREKNLSMHNLYVCFSEIRRVKQAISEGRLWEYVEMKSHAHPSLLQALKNLKKYSEYIEKHSPQIKKRGLFFFSSIGLIRPEVTRHVRRLRERYSPPEWAKILILIPDLEAKNTRRRGLYRKIVSAVCEKAGLDPGIAHVCFYSPPFGVIPMELAETYPLYQYEYAYPPDIESIKHIAHQILEYINRSQYTTVILLVEDGWSKDLAEIYANGPYRDKIKIERLPLTSGVKKIIS
jgi:7-cyano-7-deazaguanine tRNA-ribosyltransferase